jgi:hypothetical protein
MRAARAIVALVVFSWTLATAGAVAAQEPGVSIDPDSPAGKEYAIPLEAHRAAAVGRDAVDGVGQPLFGVGIAPAAAGASASKGNRRSGGSGSTRASTSKRSGSARADRAGNSRAGAADGRPRAAALIELTRPHSTTPDVLLIALSVVLGGLLAGGLIAVAARRRG